MTGSILFINADFQRVDDKPWRQKGCLRLRWVNPQSDQQLFDSPVNMRLIWKSLLQFRLLQKQKRRREHQTANRVFKIEDAFPSAAADKFFNARAFTPLIGAAG